MNLKYLQKLILLLILSFSLLSSEIFYKLNNTFKKYINNLSDEIIFTKNQIKAFNKQIRIKGYIINPLNLYSSKRLKRQYILSDLIYVRNNGYVDISGNWVKRKA